ncbi:MAG: class C sortase [Fastidiosipilaceae bacterium]
MKKHFSTIILLLVFFVGVSLLLYPTVSNWWNGRVQTRIILNYEDAVAAMDKKNYDSEFEAADHYNAELRVLVNPLIAYDKLVGYEDILNVDGSGVIGYLTIERINVELPFYHGTSDAVLNVAVGHLEGTSLPVGGEGTHAVLSTHRGLPSAKLFSNLNQLQEGDTFTIKVLNRLLTYEVDQIRIVLPEEVDDLAIEEGKDQCTLLTCTPYGINTHRLLVRGKRIENAAGTAANITMDALQIEPFLIAPMIAIPVLLILLLLLLLKGRRRK